MRDLTLSSEPMKTVKALAGSNVNKNERCCGESGTLGVTRPTSARRCVSARKLGENWLPNMWRKPTEGALSGCWCSRCAAAHCFFDPNTVSEGVGPYSNRR